MTPVLKGFVAVPHGQVHFRYGGSGPVVVMLHDSPRSSVLHAPNIEWLGEHFTVIALDTPGYGNSTPLPQPAPTIEDFADALADTLGALGIERCALYGFHTGAKIALQFAADHPERVSLAVLDGLALPAETASAEYLERYLQPFEPTADGSYLARQWTRILDFHRYYPWFAPSAATRVRMPLPGDASLHEYATDVFMAGPHWVDAYRAALSYAAGPVIATLRSRTVFMCREDDVLYGFARRIATTAAQPVQRRADPAAHGPVAHAVARRAQAGRHAARGGLVAAKAICDARQRTGAAALREPDPRAIAGPPARCAGRDTPVAIARRAGRSVFAGTLRGSARHGPPDDPAGPAGPR